MPFKSKAQRDWIYANKPEVAKEWESATPKDAKLPARVPTKPGGPKTKKAPKAKLPPGGWHQ